jgi:hypothetical protein
MEYNKDANKDFTNISLFISVFGKRMLEIRRTLLSTLTYVIVVTLNLMLFSNIIIIITHRAQNTATREI